MFLRLPKRLHGRGCQPYTARVPCWIMTLREYIQSLGKGEKGAEKFSELHGVTKRTALAYLYGARRPRTKLAARLVRDTPLTWEGIYENNGNSPTGRD